MSARYFTSSRPQEAGTHHLTTDHEHFRFLALRRERKAKELTDERA